MFQVNSNWTTLVSRSSDFLVNFQHVIAGSLCMVCEIQNLLTLQYSVYLEIPFNRNVFHIETSQVIYNPMQIDEMVLIDIRSLSRKGLDFFQVIQSSVYNKVNWFTSVLLETTENIFVCLNSGA